MNNQPDVEQLVERALRQRSSELGPIGGGADEIASRVDRRRAGRRNFAVVGSLAIIGVGLLGITALGAGRDPAPAAAGPGGSDAPTRAAWRCEQQLGYWGEADNGTYWESCERVEIPDRPTVPTVQVDAPAGDAAPAGTVPADTTPATLTPTTDFAENVDDPVISDTGLTCTPVAAPPVECALINVEQQYTVLAGDSVASIARRYRLSPDTLASYNGWANGANNPIFVGDIVRIPPFSEVTGPAATTPTG